MCWVQSVWFIKPKLYSFYWWAYLWVQNWIFKKGWPVFRHWRVQRKRKFKSLSRLGNPGVYKSIRKLQMRSEAVWKGPKTWIWFLCRYRNWLLPGHFMLWVSRKLFRRSFGIQYLLFYWYDKPAKKTSAKIKVTTVLKTLDVSIQQIIMKK